MNALIRDFQAFAVGVATIIVQENNAGTPLDQRKVPPMSGVNGIAGGEKFLKGNVFFKFSRDKHGLYGSEEAAQVGLSVQSPYCPAVY